MSYEAVMAGEKATLEEIKGNWQEIIPKGFGVYTIIKRLKVPGGWIIYRDRYLKNNMDDNCLLNCTSDSNFIHDPEWLWIL